MELFKEDARHQVNEGLKVFNRVVREIDERARIGK
jgi:hypothetical protein